MDIKMNAEALIRSLTMEPDFRAMPTKVEKDLGFSVFLSLGTEEYYMVDNDGVELVRINAKNTDEFHTLVDYMNEYCERYLEKVAIRH